MRVARVGDVYTLWNEEINKWTLLQVIEENEKGNIALLDLVNSFDVVPTAANLIDLKPLVVNHHNWSGEYSCRFIDTKKVPKRIIYVGNVDPILKLEIRTYGVTWPKTVLQVTLQHQWNQLPENIRIAYKKAKASKGKILIGDRERRLDSVSVHINGNSEAVFSCEELSKLPALSEIHFTGAANDLLSFAKKNPLISTLEWNKHDQEVIDISGTNINKLMLDVTKLKKLVLTKEIRFLSFLGDLSQLKDLEIQHPSKGKFLEINIYTKSDFQLPNWNLPNLKSLRLTLHKVDIQKITSFYPNLKSLAIWGSPGMIENLKSIVELKELESLQLNDLFGFDEHDFPSSAELPKLEFLWLTSIPKIAGSYAKKQFKHVSSLSITKLRNDKWLAENLNNPFRSWDGREGISASNAKKAFKAFKVLNTATQKELSKKELFDQFFNFIAVFNKMDDKDGLIDTIAREEIYEIYMELAQKSTQSETELFDLFEAHRDF